MKKLFCLALTTLLVLFLFGCGEEKVPEPVNPAPAKQAPAPKAALQPTPPAPASPEAEGAFPGSIDPVASPYAEPGGRINAFIGPAPKSLNYYLETSSLASTIFDFLYESMLAMNPMTLTYEPFLAESWTISQDKKTFTFKMSEKARWSDGTPVSAHDVKYTFDTIMDPKNLTGPHKVALGYFESPRVLDDGTIEFTAKEVHWRNLNALAGMQILPKHAYSPRDFNKINFELPVVSGPYHLGEHKEGVYLDLEKRADWWRKDAPNEKYKLNFQSLRFLFYAERNNAFEAFKKGLMDIYPVYTARLWVKEAQGEKFLNNWIIKQKIYNSHPLGFQGFAMNMRKPPFDDLNVRKAMAYLLNRDKMNSTLMYNQYFLQNSYYQDLYTPQNPCPNPVTPFDKKKARELLKQAGWEVNSETGLLEKDGKPFVFRFLSRNASTDKFLSIYAEDLKDVGIQMEIDKKDWAAWMKDMDEFNFEMTWAAWGGGLFKDPEPMWSSAQADQISGSNICGFKNKRVDELIEKQKNIFDVNVRHEICREVDQLVFAEYPYALLWNIDYVRLLYWNKFGTPDTILSKYSTESGAFAYWWQDPDSLADLSDAQNQGTALPAKPPVVRFHEMFQEKKAQYQH